MFNVLSKQFSLAVALGALLPTLTLAAPPTAFLERSKVIGTGKRIQAYRVPIRDADGKIKYYDIRITLPITDRGTPSTSPTLSFTRSPNVRSNQFIPGKYEGPNEETCTVRSSILDGGRSQVNMNCTTAAGYRVTATWFTGPIAGHPFEADLVAAGLDQVPGAQHLGWGRLAFDDGFRWWECFNAPDILGVSQVGNSIELSNYGNNSEYPYVQYACGATLEKTGP